MVLQTTVPAAFEGAKFILVIKDQLAFHNEEPREAGQEEHSKWFTMFWWTRPAAVATFDTKEEAIKEGLNVPHPYWWIVFDAEGNYQDGGF